MAERLLSTTEHALENQRIGGLQIRVLALCTLIQICDGYDINSIAWAVPSLIKLWHLPPPAFTMAFLWSSIGILVGALSAGPIGDRFGRRPLLLVSLTIFGVASLLSAIARFAGVADACGASSPGSASAAAFPGAASLTGDYAPHRLRATMIMATFTGAPIGGFLGGQIVALLLPHFGWPVIFVLGGGVSAGPGADPGGVAAGIAAVSRRQTEPVGAPGRSAAAPRHRSGSGHRAPGRRRRGQSGHDAVQPGLCAADRAACGSSTSAA